MCWSQSSVFFMIKIHEDKILCGICVMPQKIWWHEPVCAHKLRRCDHSHDIACWVFVSSGALSLFQLHALSNALDTVSYIHKKPPGLIQYIYSNTTLLSV